MVDIIFEKNEAIIKFPKQYISADYVQQFIERLRLEAIIEKSNLTEEQAWELSEQLKQDWWQKNKEKILKRIKN